MLTSPAVALERVAWPLPRLGEALEHLAHRARFIARPGGVTLIPPPHDDPHQLDTWLGAAATQLGLETEPVSAPMSEVDQMLQGAAPALVRLPPPDNAPDNATGQFLAITRGGPTLTLIGPDGKLHRLAARALSDILRHGVLAPWMTVAEQLLAQAGVPAERQDRVSAMLLQDQFGMMEIGRGWLVRLTPGAHLVKQAGFTGLWRPLITIFSAQVAQQILLVGAWLIIGSGVMERGFDWAWLGAWALLLFTALPFQWLLTWATSEFSLKYGALFKQRLIYGALRLKTDELRHQGIGQFLGRVMESEAVEMLALTGGWMAINAFLQLFTAGGTLALGAGGAFHVILLIVWTITLLGLSFLSFSQSRAWTRTYRAMTNELVENMVGHRTRLAQEDQRRWHVREDQVLSEYLDHSTRLDRTNAWLHALPNAWLAAGLVGLAYAFALGTTPLSALAVSLGGLMLAYQALDTITRGIQSAIQLGLAWEQVAPLFQAAARPMEAPSVTLTPAPPAEEPPPPDLDPQPEPASGELLMLAKNVSFRYRERGRRILDDCHLKIFRGDRLLLEGPSGGGKTTLAAILAGLREPESGTLLLRGFDRQSLGGEMWRQNVVAAPQFHENHVFTETFGFNLLMGRRWPALPEDLQEAEALCHALGLGDVLRKMPSGLQQIVGESGWRLSHGERSRLFIARALLQNADVVIMDESFGALDPENMALALRCALNRAKTLVVIAHP